MLEDTEFTDSGPFGPAFDTLPADLPDLHATINGLLIHIWKVEMNHPAWLERRPHVVFVRRVAHLLARALADNQPLNVTRAEPDRLIGDCRTFSILLCAILRHRGILARMCSGFATYLEPSHHQDHWVCEYWRADEQRWVMEDADLQRHDVSPEAFITASRAWLMCRETPELAARFGYSEDMCGLWAVRLNLVRDFAALNGFECVSGDYWGLGGQEEASLTHEDLALLDQVAALGMNDNVEERRRLYQATERLRAPEVIQHFDYVAGRPATVRWRDVP
jgi:hypothetical protein